MSVQIKKSEDIVTVTSPYDRRFVSGAKDLGGRWTGDAWVFDERDEDRVRDLCLDVYGVDGRADDEETVTVRIELDNDGEQEIRLAGRTIARRPSRDDRVKLSRGFIVVEGSFKDRGGSRKSPRIGTAKGVVVEGRDLPVSVAQKMVEDGENYTDGVQPGGVEIVDAEGAAQKARLAAAQKAMRAALDAGVSFEALATALKEEHLG